jgi:hypothetical protein
VLATLAAAPAAAESAIPDLRGTWKGESESIILGAGNPHHAAPSSAEPRLNSVPFTATIDKQDGRRFSGTFSSPRGNDKFIAVISRNNLKRSNPTGDEEEPLWGAFTPGGKLMMGSDDEGTYIFSLIDQNTLDYCYSETRPSPRSVCARLTRQP